MKIVIFSDLHGLTEGLRVVERVAQQQNADRMIYLGDLGHEPELIEAMHQREILCTFGNWEVSGLRRFPPQWREWIAEWPAKIEIGDICFSHATPDIPANVTKPTDAAAYIAQGVTWSQFFPRLQLNDEARWSALAALEVNNQRAAFHGHTHVQKAWVYKQGRWRSFAGPAEFTLEAGTEEKPTRYLIGVGSAGEPQDGPALRCAIYEEESKTVQLLALTNGQR